MAHLVTGALGAIGAWVVRALLDRGHDVVIYDLGGADHRLRFALADEELGRIARVNVTGTVNIFEAVRRRADRMAPLVYASSIAALAPEPGGHPTTLYGIFKRANEGTAERYFADYGVSSVGLRPATIYGPGRDQGVTSAPTAAMRAAAEGREYRIPFGGSMQFQYVADAGEAFVRAGECAPEGASVHNLDGPVASMPEVIAAIERAAPEAAGLISADETPLPFPSSVDAASFVELVGGRVSRPLDDGVAEAIARFRAS